MSELATAPVDAPDALSDGAIHPDQPISIDIDGRTLTGVGETEASLRDGLPTAQAPKDQKPTRGQQRFSQLTSERDQEAHKRAEAERERDDLKQRLEALSKPAAPPVAPVTPPAAKPVEAPAATATAFTFPTFDAWQAQHPDQSWDEWSDAKSDARTEWKLHTGQFVSKTDLDAQIRRSIEADRASRTALERETQARARGRAAYADFDAVLNTKHDAAEQWPLAKLQAIFELDQFEHVQYALLKQPDLAQRLRDEPNMVKFGMAIAQLIPSSPVASPASTGTAGPFIIPAPHQPVGSGSKTAVLSASDLAERAGEDYDSSGFREQKRTERGRR